MSYDIRIWEEIRDRVSWKTNKLPEDIKREIASDRSLQEFQGPDPTPWQLRQVMQQRAESWIQRLYDSCCDAYQALGKKASVEFDRAVWAYCIEPFIMTEMVNDHGYRASELLELLLLAVGSPPERRRLLRVNQKEACIAVRGRIWEFGMTNFSTSHLDGMRLQQRWRASMPWSAKRTVLQQVQSRSRSRFRSRLLL
jgi:hypothetical protein